MVLLHPHPGILEFLAPPLLILTLIVLWTVSFFGLYRSSYRSTTKGLLTLLFVFVPPAAVIWMGIQLYQKQSFTAGEADNGRLSHR